MDTTSVALQLYTVRDELGRDFPGTLRRVAELGYTAVECAGYGGLNTQDMIHLLAETGLRAAGTHVRLEALEQNLDQEIAYCRAIGCPFLVLPWLAPDMRNAETMRQLAPRLNEFGRRCRQEGIAFAYHNHDFEFARSEQNDDRSTLFEILLGGTDPSLVGFEFDVYWAAYAGIDPVSFLQQHAGRIPIIHAKDMSPSRTFTEVGDGTLNLAHIIQVARETGTQWYIVENDKPSMPSLESAKRSLENIRRM